MNDPIKETLEEFDKSIQEDTKDISKCLYPYEIEAYKSTGKISHQRAEHLKTCIACSVILEYYR